MKEPKIRLKGFSGEWEEMYLLNLATSISSGKDSPTKGRFPLYGSTGVIGTVNTPSHNGPLLLVARVGANAGHLQLVYDKCGITDNTLVVSPKTDTPLDYLYYYFQHTNLNRLVYGSGQPLITGGMLKQVVVCMGCNDERNAITSYFQHLDSLIQSTTKKIESLKQVKAASLQSMFPQEGETVPRVRFKGFEGEWEKVPLNRYAKRINRKNKNLESTLALTISSIDGLVSQIDYFNNLVVGANIANYYLLKKGEFAYNKSYSRGYPFGSVKRLDRYEQGILSTLYIVFSINSEISSDYLTHFFSTNLWHKQVAERAEEGARNHGLLNIGADDFMSIDIVIPHSCEEQQKIADYISNLDNQISLQTKRLDKLKQIKSACLDNMFV